MCYSKRYIILICSVNQTIMFINSLNKTSVVVLILELEINEFFISRQFFFTFSQLLKSYQSFYCDSQYIYSSKHTVKIRK